MKLQQPPHREGANSGRIILNDEDDARATTPALPLLTVKMRRFLFLGYSHERRSSC